MRHDRLGDILIAYDAITDQQLSIVLHEQQRCNIRLGDVLRLKQVISEGQLKHALAVQNDLRSKNRHKRALALADMAINTYTRKRAIDKRKELRSKADRISDEYPTLFSKKG